jgi:hypothetical protein
MKKIIRAEELAITAAAIYHIYTLHMGFSWWVYLLLFFAPDISMLGYVAGNATGAFFYNLFHHKGVALAVAAVGVWLASPVIIFAGLILFAHSSFDRMMGYGLKYVTGFKHTHLGDL